MKQYFKLYFILFSLLLFIGIFTSCKKDKQKITINGTVYDPNTKTYVSNAHVTLSASMVSSGFYNSNYTEVASTTTDGSGAFSFNFDKLKSAGYRIYISKENYFDNTIDIDDASVVAGTPYTAKYDLYQIAWMKLHVTHTTPHDSSDYIAYDYSSTGLPTCFGCCSNNIFKAYGMTYDTTLRCKTYGSRYMKINWHVIMFGWDALQSDSVFCTPFDTTLYTINY